MNKKSKILQNPDGKDDDHKHRNRGDGSNNSGDSNIREYSFNESYRHHAADRNERKNFGELKSDESSKEDWQLGE